MFHINHEYFTLRERRKEVLHTLFLASWESLCFANLAWEGGATGRAAGAWPWRGVRDGLPEERVMRSRLNPSVAGRLGNPKLLN